MPDVPAVGARRRFPLHLTLAAVFVTLFVVFGLALIGFFHSESKRIELLGADDLMDRIGRHMQTSIAELYLPAQSVVDVASKSVPLASSDLVGRLAALGALTEALRLNPHMSSIFVGYENGDFFLVRSVGDRRVAAQALDAPSGSRFAVQSIERGARLRGTLLFLDDTLEVLDRRPLPTTNFDPLGRVAAPSRSLLISMSSSPLARLASALPVGWMMVEVSSVQISPSPISRPGSRPRR
jgi:hypothetical protein